MASAAEFGPLFQPVTFSPGVPSLLAPPPQAVDDDGPLKTFVGPIYQIVFFLPSLGAPPPGGSPAPPPGGGPGTTPGIVN
ncbi:MAG TPA: hypothetical protein VFA98_02780 [Thermoanaerobaculia bacterium]|jgi:hypothetical protein|nr:hypothetical protein [Thermoanaerobaculia bacterium]